ncbi:spermidine synthase [Sphingomonas sp. Root710]|uniref:spermidine synthase n=1 Tax=Sphingomonas sp. Root710 TaxID=1736594 RepID=UPI0006FADF2A|nr:spermidine synthase [Sphingomonas sp. Root710]KRB86238.1 spermidine synthase [Sphingomonas sp. Root710]
MIPLEQLDSTKIPGTDGELRLMRRGRDHMILFGRNELMSSRLRGSEEALAALPAERLRDRSRPRFLIGGLGMGFTLRAALDQLPPKAEIVVAELVPAIVEWARGPLAHLFGDSLDDPRVTIRVGDVGDAIATPAEGYDAILLDVDNGPDALVHPDNDKLYGDTGLRAARAALKPGGILAIWSAYQDKVFANRLKRAGFEVDEVKVRATGGRKGAHHVIWLAKR